MEWGPNIHTGQKRPEWLKDDKTPLYWHDSGWQGGRSTAGQLEWVQRGDPLEYIQLPADHSAYAAIAKGFTPWGGGSEAPEDWDGEYTLTRDGDEKATGYNWVHDGGFRNIIGYHPKPIAQPSPADTVTLARMTEAQLHEAALAVAYEFRGGWRQAHRDLGLIRPATKAEQIATKTGLSVKDVEAVLSAAGEGK